MKQFATDRGADRTRQRLRRRPHQPAGDAARPRAGAMTAAGRLMSAGRARSPWPPCRGTPARRPQPEPLEPAGLRHGRPDDLQRRRFVRRGARHPSAAPSSAAACAWSFPADRTSKSAPGASRRTASGRSSTSTGQVFPLGIPTDGHDDAARDHRRLALPRRCSARGSRRTSAAATPRCATRRPPSSPATDDDVSDRFNGFHLTGGADFRLARWIAVGGDVAWTSIADAIGESGASAVFEEDNLGGTSLRVRLILGR